MSEIKLSTEQIARAADLIDTMNNCMARIADHHEETPERMREYHQAEDELRGLLRSDMQL